VDCVLPEAALGHLRTPFESIEELNDLSTTCQWIWVTSYGNVEARFFGSRLDQHTAGP
jgi:hypothetical protein